MSDGPAHIASVARDKISAITPRLLPGYPFVRAAIQEPLTDGYRDSVESIRAYAVWFDPDPRHDDDMWNGTCTEVRQTMRVELRYAADRETLAYPVRDLVAEDAMQVAQTLVEEIGWPDAPSVLRARQLGSAEADHRGGGVWVASLDFEITHAFGGTD